MLRLLKAFAVMLPIQIIFVFAEILYPLSKKAFTPDELANAIKSVLISSPMEFEAAL